ncbi:MAG: polysaccharide biosynthesis tyrosine autokinase [Chitinophagaceae bacterium]
MIDFESEHIRQDQKIIVQQESFSMEKLLLILKKYWYWLPISIIISLIGGHYYLKYTKPLYVAGSLIRLEIQKEASNIGMTTVQTMQSDNNLLSEIELIKSRLVAEELINTLDLNVSYYAVGNILTTEIYNKSPFRVEIYSDPSHTLYEREFVVSFVSKYQFKLFEKGGDESKARTYAVGDIIQLGKFKFALQWSSVKENDIDKKEYIFKVNSRSSLVSYLLGQLMVEASSTEARTLTISFLDNNADKARDIVNAYDTVYLKQSIEKKQKSQEQTLKFIETQIENTASKLEEYENNIENFVKRTGSISPNSEYEQVAKQLEELQKNKEDVAKSVKKFDELLSFIQSNSSKTNIVPLVFGIDNIQIADGINELNNLYKSREMLKISNKESTVPFKKLELEISIIKSQLLNYITETKKYVAEQNSELNSKMSMLTNQFSGLPNKETELNRLKRFNSLYEKYYLSLIEKQIEYQISKAGTVPEFTILSQAYVSPKPVSPNRQRIWLMFILAGVVPVLLFLFLKYMFMNVIYSQQQIESKLMAPILGSIPSYKKKMSASTLVVDKNPKSSISEALRSIRTNSDFMLPKKSKQIIGVTSTISGEGKTFFAINYAAILALTGKKVVILDLDMRKPKIHVGFNVDNSIGMSSILSGMTTWKEAVQHSTLHNLDLIPAGPIPPNPNELLLKKEFDDLIDQLFLEYDIIMADNPPIGLVTDANNVFKKCDLSIYVVRSGYSKENVINNINNLYKSKNYTNLSVIINDVNRSNTYGNKYGYGYGYGYGYYEDDGGEHKHRSRIKRFLKKK